MDFHRHFCHDFIFSIHVTYITVFYGPQKQQRAIKVAGKQFPKIGLL